MSAVPKPAALAIPEEELDLLISRALDADLLPEEQALLDEILATNAAARARTAELAGTVDALHALPKLSPPFALATRVNARVRDTEGGPLGIKLSVMRGIGSFAVAVMILFMAVTIIKKGQEDKKAEALVAQAKKAADDAPVNVPVFFSKDAKEQAAPAAEPAAAGAPVAEATGTPGAAGPKDAAPKQMSEREPVVLADAGRFAEEKAREGESAAAKAGAAPGARSETTGFEKSKRDARDDRSDAQGFAPESTLAKAESAQPALTRDAEAKKNESASAPAPAPPAPPAPARPAEQIARAQVPSAPSMTGVGATRGAAGKLTQSDSLSATSDEDARRRARLASMSVSVSVVEPAGVKLVSSVAPGSLIGPIEDDFRLTVDASGHVSKVSMSFAPEQTVRSDVKALLEALVFDVGGVRRKGADAPVEVQVRLLARVR